MSMHVTAINKKLADLHGKHDDGRPYFRIAWTTDQTETRLGTFRYYTEAGLFTYEETCVRERKKYPYIKDRWLLEKLTFPKQKLWSPDLIGIWNGSYEPVWCFNKEGNYQIPEWWAVERLVKAALYGPEAVKKTADDLYEEENKRMKKEIDLNYDILDNETPEMAHALKEGSGVSYSNLDAKKLILTP